MHFVGIDLAWGSKGTTGLAVVDQSGALLAATTRKADQDILAWLRPRVTGPCVVAIDAPMIVTNKTGSRDCERLINRYFGRYHASCHASNTSKPYFANGTRASRLADQLGLAVDPASQSDRRAIEVYPHPAMVALFNLPRVLQYKQKHGRDLAHLRSETLRLLTYLENLEHGTPPLRTAASPDWLSIRRAVEGATRKADLGTVEDAVDAVMCAYIAAYADAKSTAVRVFGTASTGYILTPVTPEIAEWADRDGTLSNRPPPPGNARSMPYAIVTPASNGMPRVIGPFATSDDADRWLITRPEHQSAAVIRVEPPAAD